MARRSPRYFKNTQQATQNCCRRASIQPRPPFDQPGFAVIADRSSSIGARRWRTESSPDSRQSFRAAALRPPPPPRRPLLDSFFSPRSRPGGSPPCRSRSPSSSPLLSSRCRPGGQTFWSFRARQRNRFVGCVGFIRARFWTEGRGRDRGQPATAQ